MKNIKRILVTVSDEELKIVQTLADKQKWSKSKTAREALLFYLRARKATGVATEKGSNGNQ